MMHIELLGYHCHAIFVVFQDSRDIWMWHCIIFLIHRGFCYTQ